MRLRQFYSAPFKLILAYILSQFNNRALKVIIVELIWICFIVDSPGMNALISVSMDIVSLIHGIFF